MIRWKQQILFSFELKVVLKKLKTAGIMSLEGCEYKYVFMEMDFAFPGA